jgi:hypothetical protein
MEQDSKDMIMQRLRDLRMGVTVAIGKPDDMFDYSFRQAIYETFRIPLPPRGTGTIEQVADYLIGRMAIKEVPQNSMKLTT